MKKFLTMLLALAIVFAMAIPTFAEEDIENFAADLKWTQGTLGSASNVTEADGVTTATGITHAFSSPVIDILPAVKEAIGEDDEVELTISFEARANFVSGKEGAISSGRVLLRGKDGLGLPGPDNAGEWNATYQESLDGEDPLFNNDNGNIMKYLNANVRLTDTEWSTCRITIFLYQKQVSDPSVLAWNLCIDAIPNPAIFESIQFRNVIVTTDVLEEEEPEEPADEPADKPAENKPAENKPAENKPAENKPAENKPAENKPVENAPQVQAPSNNAPANNNGVGTVNTTAILITAIAAAAVIIAACVVAVIVVKKKTTK